MSASHTPQFGLILGGLVVASVFAWQQHSLSRLRSELRGLQTAPAPTGVARPAEPPAERRVTRPAEGRAPRVAPSPDDGLTHRVAALEDSVALLSRGSDYLMDRGQIPASPAKAAELRATFLDASRSTRDRLGALRLLRRNEVFTDDLVDVAAQWLVGSTNAEVTRTLLESLRGLENPSFKSALQTLAASTAGDRRVRETAISGLRDFVGDPQVETLLWQLASADPSAETRRRAEETLRRAPLNEVRATALTTRALNPNVALDERLLSLRMLQESKPQLAQVAPTLAQASQLAQDPETRIKFYEAFDDVNHPEFMLPLVQGLQDPNAAVRSRAADALVDYRANPTVLQWLKVLSESDPDPAVRQQAARAFREEGRRDGPSRR